MNAPGRCSMHILTLSSHLTRAPRSSSPTTTCTHTLKERIRKEGKVFQRTKLFSNMFLLKFCLKQVFSKVVPEFYICYMSRPRINSLKCVIKILVLVQFNKIEFIKIQPTCISIAQVNWFLRFVH